MPYKTYYDDWEGECLIHIEGENCKILGYSLEIYNISDLVEVLGSKENFPYGFERVLDLGGTYVRDNGDFERDQRLLAEELLKNPYVWKALSVDLRTPTKPAHQKLTVVWDFLDESVKESALELLGGKPDLVIASQILISDLPEYMWVRGTPWYRAIGADYIEKLAFQAWEVLQPGGLLLVDNIDPCKWSDQHIPEFLRNKKDNLKYLNREPLLARVYEKPLSTKKK